MASDGTTAVCRGVGCFPCLAVALECMRPAEIVVDVYRGYGPGALPRRLPGQPPQHRPDPPQLRLPGGPLGEFGQVEHRAELPGRAHRDAEVVLPGGATPARLRDVQRD